MKNSRHKFERLAGLPCLAEAGHRKRRGVLVKEPNSGGDQSEHGSRLHQEAEARRDAYIAGRDQIILRAEAAERCNCGLYAVGACHACDLPLCGQHGASIGGLFLCGAHRHPAVLEQEPRDAEASFRPSYVHQVRQIFAGELLDRKAELAELSQFAASGDGCPYVWWQGEAWAGKSALMASFVLNPPPGVRVVSFFITSRFAGQSDRAAFLDAVLEQLSELLGQAAPDALTELISAIVVPGTAEAGS